MSSNKILNALLLLLNFSLINGMNITASTSVKTATVGQPFTMKCEVGSFKLENEQFDLFFEYKINENFAYFEIPASSKQAKFGLNINEKDKPYIAHVQPLEHSFPVFEISIIPKTVFSTEFYCQGYSTSSISVYSNQVHLSVIKNQPTTTPIPTTLPPPPKLTLTSSEKTVHLNKPLTITCSITQFNKKEKEYSVKYFSNRHGLLASYEIDESTKKSTFSPSKSTNFLVHQGHRSFFPAFDLVITEKIDRRQSYWCELESAGKKYSSLHWKAAGPFLDFSTSTIKNGTSTVHRSRCTVEDFAKHSEQEYQILFYSNFELEKRNNESLLAYYQIRPHKILEFINEHPEDSSNSITHGSIFTYPNFEILTQFSFKVDSNKRWSWWCALRTTDADKREQLFESNQVSLI